MTNEVYVLCEGSGCSNPREAPDVEINIKGCYRTLGDAERELDSFTYPSHYRKSDITNELKSEQPNIIIGYEFMSTDVTILFIQRMTIQ
jgi:hypothetical protein